MAIEADDAKQTVDLDTAIAMLPDGEMVHTFRSAGLFTLGADHERSKLIEAMRKAPEIELAGPVATRMGHGLALWDEHGPLFIATKRPS